MNNLEKLNENSYRKKFEYFFYANSSDHTLSQTHFTFHGLLIAALSVIISNSDKIPFNKLLIFLLGAIGIISTFISFFAFKRAYFFKKFWENEIDPSLFKEIENYLNEKCLLGKDSRENLLICIFFIYLIFVIFNFFDFGNILSN